jgi:hypothetical protein
LTPFKVTLVVFHELMYVPRELDCQQRVPAPSKVNGAVIVEDTGLQAEPLPEVGEAATVWVGVAVTTTGVGVRDGVLVGPVETVGVLVRVGEAPSVGVLLGVCVAVAPPLVGMGVRLLVEAILK